MKDRIKRIRSDAGLTQQEFADRIHGKRNTVANYETGRNLPSSAVITLISREFGVNEGWLRTGEGEVYAPRVANGLDDLAKAHGLSPTERLLIERFVCQPPEVRAGILRFMRDFASAAAEAPEEPEPKPPLDYHAELDRVQNLTAESEEGSGASGSIASNSA